MFIIDTNILVSVILVRYEQDDRTLRFRAFFEAIPLIKRIVPDFILNEFELLMTKVMPSRYKNKMDEAEKEELQIVTSAFMERMIGDYTLFSPSPALIKKAFQLYKRYENTHYISFTDSLLLATAQENGYTLITKDERVNARAKELKIIYYEPPESTA